MSLTAPKRLLPSSVFITITPRISCNPRPQPTRRQEIRRRLLDIATHTPSNTTIPSRLRERSQRLEPVPPPCFLSAARLTLPASSLGGAAGAAAVVTGAGLAAGAAGLGLGGGAS